MHNVQTIAHKHKPNLAMAVVRTICYAWCTPTRFGNSPQPCPFCRKRNRNNLRHICQCKILCNHGIDVLRQPHLPRTRKFFFWPTSTHHNRTPHERSMHYTFMRPSIHTTRTNTIQHTTPETFMSRTSTDNYATTTHSSPTTTTHNTRTSGTTTQNHDDPYT